MKIDKILLRAERPEYAPEDTLGITRIEEVVKVMEEAQRNQIIVQVLSIVFMKIAIVIFKI